jgi:hypothetical protein
MHGQCFPRFHPRLRNYDQDGVLLPGAKRCPHQDLQYSVYVQLIIDGKTAGGLPACLINAQKNFRLAASNQRPRRVNRRKNGEIGYGSITIKRILFWNQNIAFHEAD